MNKHLLLVGLFLSSFIGNPANAEDTIESFHYESDTAAQQTWVAREGTPEVKRYAGKAGNAMLVQAPFASQSDLTRAVLDRDARLNLNTSSRFTLEVKVANPEATRSMTLYFRSGDGWYSAGANLTERGWTTLRFDRSSFSTEGTPAGWDKIDGVRIAVWRSNQSFRQSADAAVDTSLLLRNLTKGRYEVAIVLPDQDDEDSRSSHDAAERIEKMLAELGIEVDRLSESEIGTGVLGDRRFAILPYNRPSDTVCKRLIEYVENGGKLFLCYDIPNSLREVLGFRRGEYYRPGEGESQLASIHFDANDIPGLPNVVEQASWNIAAYEPSGHGARVIGTWYNGDGKSTGKAAMLMSDRAVYMSHVVLSDDWQNKKKMLAAILGKLDNRNWQEIATTQLQRAERVGHCDSAEQLREAVSWRLDEAKRNALDQADRELASARTAMAENRFFDAYQQALLIEERRADVYLKSQPSPAVEARAFWEHSGVGPYPGDWDRTCRELSDAGINMIIPNMLWAGVAHYKSDVLPESADYKQHGDQIEQCLAAARKHGLEVHVWKVNHNPGHLAPPAFIEQMRKEGRTQVDREGNVTDWLNPAHPDNFKLEVDSMLEVVRNYDVDGIHFDYIRYPNNDLDYSDFSRKKFEADTGNKVANWPADCYDGELHDAYRDWRAAQINRLVETVSREARKIRPSIKISAAVFSAYPSCRVSVGQDWPVWAKLGYVDFICPMNYTDDDEEFTSWITNQKKVAPNIPIYAGIGARSGRSTLTADRVVGQIAIARKLQTGGFTIFDLNGQSADSILPGLKASACSTHATPPHRESKANLIEASR